MPTDSEILGGVRKAFASCPRPAIFSTWPDCDKLFRSRDIDTLSIDAAKDIGADCPISPEGFAYYLPALARLVLAEPDERHDWYGVEFLFLLRDGERRWVCLPDQRRSVVALLRHIFETRAELVDEYSLSKDLQDVIEYWSVEYQRL